MNRQIGKEAKSGKRSWVFWLLFFGIIMIIIYGISEYYLDIKQPSSDWSLGIKILEDVPNDFRKIDYINSRDDEGITIAYVIDNGIQLGELDNLGKVQRSLEIPIDNLEIKVLTIELVEDKYNIYISDRKVLDKIDIDIDKLSIINKERISNNSEQFDTVGSNIIVGDDIKTDIIIDGDIVVSYDNYEDLKKVNIRNHNGKVYASMDTVQGGDIIVINNDKVIRNNITDKVEQDKYGYITDLYMKNNTLNVISHYFNVTEDMPTLLGVWQLDANNLEKKDFMSWHHPRTTLEPKIVDVSDEKISYVLGMQQRENEDKEHILQFPTEQSGNFTNLSLYTRDKSKLVDYTRLTNTDKYPLGYEYIKSGENDRIIWIDKSEENSNLMMAGKGDIWINNAIKNMDKNYISYIQETILIFMITPIWGFIFFILDIGSHWKLILLFSGIMFIINKINKDKKYDKIYMLGIIIFIIFFKFYINSIANDQLKQYTNIYPNLFGNNSLLGIISILTSIFSIFIYRLWDRGNQGNSKLIKSSVFIGIEVYFQFFSILVYLQSAMLKVKYMV